MPQEKEKLCDLAPSWQNLNDMAIYTTSKLKARINLSHRRLHSLP
jgi:hypothetical protein